MQCDYTGLHVVAGPDMNKNCMAILNLSVVEYSELFYLLFLLSRDCRLNSERINSALNEFLN
jgi:hypothetical protein